jgi:hypothetical protein
MFTHNNYQIIHQELGDLIENYNITNISITIYIYIYIYITNTISITLHTHDQCIYVVYALCICDALLQQ